jgi:hypothetical protein
LTDALAFEHAATFSLARLRLLLSAARYDRRAPSMYSMYVRANTALRDGRSQE